ncbi:5-methyltetrahydropteroyltriglutamate--homocysteine S-methyltransferase [Paenibacillus camerounensis]|uniref:5-methyltetrahydropteroyltriglutamate-- homocysteine S-methyltransferase n=1 Tax=Paenibacillus camerounensis TaxID=1243663 RepID=UPI0005A875C1|nr:5-methyltetrahydropteroyltriglutamate--homocysteine S-methyltransferase [Paenibacillus camerounensis]
MCIAHAAPFRFDIVGSFLRPAELKEAREKYAGGEIPLTELKAVEDKCIIELVHKQKQAGLKVATDGEFRRSWWHLDFFWGLQGVAQTESLSVNVFKGTPARSQSAELTGKISGKDHPFLEHFRFVKSIAGEGIIVRQTIPSPTQFFHHLVSPANLDNTNHVYPEREGLIRDIVAAYRTVISDLYAAGCRNVQLDDCSWGQFFEGRSTAFDADRSTDEQRKEEKLRINNLVLANHPEDLRLTTHVCRGNFRSAWATYGGYEPVAEALFARQNVDAYYLEYDSERAGGFEPLRYMGKDKKVVLGLITSKTPELENKETILARIREAAQYVELDRLYLSPQCGFASTEEGNLLTEEEQWAKLNLIREIAEEVWGAE